MNGMHHVGLSDLEYVQTSYSALWVEDETVNLEITTAVELCWHSTGVALRSSQNNGSESVIEEYNRTTRHIAQ